MKIMIHFIVIFILIKIIKATYTDALTHNKNIESKLNQQKHALLNHVKSDEKKLEKNNESFFTDNKYNLMDFPDTSSVSTSRESQFEGTSQKQPDTLDSNLKLQINEFETAKIQSMDKNMVTIENINSMVHKNIDTINGTKDEMKLPSVYKIYVPEPVLLFRSKKSATTSNDHSEYKSNSNIKAPIAKIENHINLQQPIPDQKHKVIKEVIDQDGYQIKYIDCIIDDFDGSNMKSIQKIVNYSDLPVYDNQTHLEFKNPITKEKTLVFFGLSQKFGLKYEFDSNDHNWEVRLCEKYEEPKLKNNNGKITEKSSLLFAIKNIFSYDPIEFHKPKFWKLFNFRNSKESNKEESDVQTDLQQAILFNDNFQKNSDNDRCKKQKKPKFNRCFSFDDFNKNVKQLNDKEKNDAIMVSNTNINIPFNEKFRANLLDSTKNDYSNTFQHSNSKNNQFSKKTQHKEQNFQNSESLAHDSSDYHSINNPNETLFDKTSLFATDHKLFSNNNHQNDFSIDDHEKHDNNFQHSNLPKKFNFSNICGKFNKLKNFFQYKGNSYMLHQDDSTYQENDEITSIQPEKQNDLINFSAKIDEKSSFKNTLLEQQRKLEVIEHDKYNKLLMNYPKSNDISSRQLKDTLIQNHENIHENLRTCLEITQPSENLLNVESKSSKVAFDPIFGTQNVFNSMNSTTLSSSLKSPSQKVNSCDGREENSLKTRKKKKAKLLSAL